MKERLRGSKAELSWLMRTSYISNETDSRRQAAVPKTRPEDAVDRSADADEAHLEAAEVHVQGSRFLVGLVDVTPCTGVLRKEGTVQAMRWKRLGLQYVKP